jgi:hypothetical protein
MVYHLIIKYSANGPRAKAGRKLSAPTIITTTISQIMKSDVCVGKVPELTGTFFFCTNEPAIASAGIAAQ